MPVEPSDAFKVVELNDSWSCGVRARKVAALFGSRTEIFTHSTQSIAENIIKIAIVDVQVQLRYDNPYP